MVSSDDLIWIYVSIQATMTLAVGILASRVVWQTTKHIQSFDRNDQIKFSTWNIIELWFKTTWQMRSIYGCLIVHIFDFTTDLLVIDEWFTKEDKGNIPGVDARLMAWWSLGVLLFYRFVSALAILVITCPVLSQVYEPM